MKNSNSMKYISATKLAKFEHNLIINNYDGNKILYWESGKCFYDKWAFEELHNEVLALFEDNPSFILYNIQYGYRQSRIIPENRFLRMFSSL